MVFDDRDYIRVRVWESLSLVINRAIREIQKLMYIHKTPENIRFEIEKNKGFRSNGKDSVGMKEKLWKIFRLKSKL